MTRLTTLDINKLTPYAVGFDKVFEDMFRYIDHNTSSTGYHITLLRTEKNFKLKLLLQV